MSWLKWKQENGRRKIFIITNPVSIILCALFCFSLLLPIVRWLRSILP